MSDHYHAVRNTRVVPSEENGFQPGPEARTVLDTKSTPELANAVNIADEADWVAPTDAPGTVAWWEVNGPCDCDPAGAEQEAEENAEKDAEANEPDPFAAAVDDDQS